MGTVTFTVYLSEIAPAKKRGSMITSFQLAWTAKMFIANIVNLQIVKATNWQFMFNIVLFIPVLMLILSFYLPKSPRCLDMRGKINEAEEIVKSI